MSTRSNFSLEVIVSLCTDVPPPLGKSVHRLVIVHAYGEKNVCGQIVKKKENACGQAVFSPLSVIRADSLFLYIEPAGVAGASNFFW